MYLPHNVPLCRPHVHVWIGESGKRYDFAVCRPGTIRMDEPAVYILARHEVDVITPLFVGCTGSLHRHFGLSSERCPEEWGRALAMGMTHLHLRFEASSTTARRAEVRDLVAALRPTLNESVLDQVRSMPALEAAEGVGSRERSSGLAAVDGGWYGSRGFPPRPPFRADPAREDDSGPGNEDDGARGFEAPVAVVDQKPDLRRRPDMQSAAAASANAEVVAVTRAAKPVGLAGLFRRVREFVAGTRTPRPPDSPEDVGSAEPRPAAASVLVGSVEPGSLAASVLAPPAAPPAAAVSAEPKAGPDEMCEAAREDGEPVRREQFADVKPAEVCSEEPAGTSEDAPPPEPIAEVAFVGQQEAKRGLDLALSSPMVLFAGNLAYEAGADILLDAIITVCCSGDREALFLFAGEGGMRHEMQKRVSGAGLERRCRFLGDVPASDFDRVLRACDFVVIPGRVPQGEDLARMAVANGKPVLTTHQAAIGGVVVHGRNGLIAYDNPHSLVWGIRELLGPVYANLRREVKAAA